MALRWEQEGAELLHVVDLDGAFNRSPQNLEAVERILNRIHIPVQLGGGIRNMEIITLLLGMGVNRVILGTEAIRNPHLIEQACEAHPGRILVGIDARNGMVAIEGWTETTQVRAVDVARGFDKLALAGIVFTDIHKDGMRTGPNLAETRRMAEAVSTPIIASGGVANIGDILALRELEEAGVVGVITGRALYDGTLRLGEALNAARG
jgi:phosphoribosylformimino-5-aminoimidazole carboxamide ribotide isomerase